MASPVVLIGRLVPPLLWRVVLVPDRSPSAIAGPRNPRLFLPLVPAWRSRPTGRPPGRSVCRDCFCILTQRCLRFPNPIRVLSRLAYLRPFRIASPISSLPPANWTGCCLRRRIAGSGTARLLLRPSEAIWERNGPAGLPRLLVEKLPDAVAFRLIVFLAR